MLLQLHDYIKRNQMIGLDQIAREFRIDKQALQPMIDIWVKKGKIRACQERKLCGGGCVSSCKINRPIFYEWIS